MIRDQYVYCPTCCRPIGRPVTKPGTYNRTCMARDCNARWIVELESNGRRVMYPVGQDNGRGAFPHNGGNMATKGDR